MAARQKQIGKAGWGWSLFAGAISLIYFFPVLWIILTAFKTRPEQIGDWIGRIGEALDAA